MGNKFEVCYSDVNGPQGQGSYRLSANTLIGAKREATRLSAGTTTGMTLYRDGAPIAERYAEDSYRGCCCGWRHWQAL